MLHSVLRQQRYNVFEIQGQTQAKDLEPKELGKQVRFRRFPPFCIVACFRIQIPSAVQFKTCLGTKVATISSLLSRQHEEISCSIWSKGEEEEEEENGKEERNSRPNKVERKAERLWLANKR